MTFEGVRTVGVRQCVVLVPLPRANEPVVLEAPEGFPIWAGCMPSPCPYEWREGEFTQVPGVIVMWEERFEFCWDESKAADSLEHFTQRASPASTSPEPLKASAIFQEGL